MKVKKKRNVLKNSPTFEHNKVFKKKELPPGCIPTMLEVFQANLNLQDAYPSKDDRIRILTESLIEQV